MSIVVLCVCNFIAEKINVRQKPSVFGNASGTAIGMVGEHTIDVGPLGVFHAMRGLITISAHAGEKPRKC
jgi:hypothetical protein